MYDFSGDKISSAMHRFLNISLRSSASRFGFQAVLLTIGFFFISLFIGVQVGRSLMWWALWLGIAFILLAIYFSVYFLRNQPEDITAKKLNALDAKLDKLTKLDTLDDILLAINNLAEQIKSDRENRNGQCANYKPKSDESKS
jgi:hypothetical protein